MKLIFIASHPTQYHAPLYRYLANVPEFDVEVWYCSDEGMRMYNDKGFGINIQWDIPLLDGYDYRFLKNDALKPSISNGFLGLINFSLIDLLRQTPPATIIIPGWQYATFIIAIVAAYRFGHKVCLRTETPLSHELIKSGWKSRIRKWVMKYLIFPRVDTFLFIGKENRDFYLHYGIPENRLVFSPYSVDNKRFSDFIKMNKAKKKDIRSLLGLPVDKKIILFCGKYIEKKNPTDIIIAYERMEASNKCLVMVGEGHLRITMEQLINQKNIKNIFLTGFVNQNDIPMYYLAADIFVMASDYGETWGLAVNEAMNFALPVIVYERTGCAVDLVQPGENGYIVPNGDILALTQKMELLLNNDVLRTRFGEKSFEIIQKYDFNTVANNLKLV